MKIQTTKIKETDRRFVNNNQYTFCICSECSFTYDPQPIKNSPSKYAAQKTQDKQITQSILLRTLQQHHRLQSHLFDVTNILKRNYYIRRMYLYNESLVTCLVTSWCHSENTHCEIAIGESQEGGEQNHPSLVTIFCCKVECWDQQESRKHCYQQTLSGFQLQPWHKGNISCYEIHHIIHSNQNNWVPANITTSSKIKSFNFFLLSVSSVIRGTKQTNTKSKDLIKVFQAMVMYLSIYLM